MFVFLLGPNYALPLTMIELDSFSYEHTHRTAWHTTWKEDMHLRVCLPAVVATRLRVANDNQKAA